MEPRVRSRMRPRRHNGGGTRRYRRRLIGVLVAAAAVLSLTPASASALGFTGLVAEPSSNDQAGANADFHIHVGFTSPSDDVHDIRISLPPGQIGNPLATPQCTLAQFNAPASCPANTQVGSVVTTVQALSLPLPLPVNGKLFNLVPNAGEPARFGIFLSPTGGLLPLGDIRLQSSVELRLNDFGLDTVINPIPNTAAELLPIDITAMDVTLFGESPMFARNPTSCAEATTNFLAHSYAAPGTDVTGSASYTPTGCENVDFSPSFTAEVGGPGQTTNGVPTTASTAILQDNEEAGLRKAVVRVPGDLVPNSALFFGPPCEQADFVNGSCPSNTVVGLATAASPLLSQPLIGNVSLVRNPDGTFPRLGLDLKGQLHLLLQGTTDIAGGNTVTFGDVPPGLPDIPISRFQLTFNPSPGLLTTSRDICVPPAPVFHADFTGYNDKTASVDAPATVLGCGPVKKCKKAKKKKKKGKQRAAEAKKKKGKKKGKKKCPKKKKKKGKKKR
jgi:hypothetical protein